MGFDTLQFALADAFAGDPLNLLAQCSQYLTGRFTFSRHTVQEKNLRPASKQAVVGAGTVRHPVSALRQSPVQAGATVAVEHGGQDCQRQRITAGS